MGKEAYKQKATPKQIAYLIKLGYEEDAEQLSKNEAKILIKELSEEKYGKM